MNDALGSGHCILDVLCLDHVGVSLSAVILYWSFYQALVTSPGPRGSLDEGDLGPLGVILTTTHKSAMISDLKVSVKTKQRTFAIRSLGLNVVFLLGSHCVCVRAHAHMHVLCKRDERGGVLSVLHLFGFLHLCSEF